MTARDRLAALKIQNKDIPGAEKLLAEVLAKSPRDNDALILRGNLALAQKDPKSAIVDLRAVLRDQPNAVGVMRTLARAHLANGEPALAEETMRRAADVNAKDLGARLDLAQLLAQIGKPDQAKPVIDELVALQPNSGLGYYYQGATAESMKHQEEAARLYSVALDKQPDSSEALQALSLVLVKLNRTPEALKRLDDASAKFPSLPLALNVKGDILLVAQHPAEAAVAFQGAIERTPTWWLPYRGLARAQSAGHDDAAAMATLQSGISKATQPESLEIDLARMFEVSGKADDAIKLYETTLRQDPHSDVAANNLAMVLVTFKTDRPSLDRAKDLAQRFSSSPNTAFLDTYGWVLYKRGDSSAAVSVLQSVLSKAPESPVALYHLGMAQASAGQPDAARENLTLSLKSGKAFPGMDEAKATLDKLAKLSAITTSIAPRS